MHNSYGMFNNLQSMRNNLNGLVQESLAIFMIGYLALDRYI